ncbi:hypothetical protein GCM10025876_24160 [Demequina litorisediminis]|uniref:Uncharacterized protein n=1 Tax=Demequina litorisediminis TaxID=1849022 RepID=A0ABQ6IGC1_9MICO|nr:hypothetical protein GCM10025876_24160 [Demequina litorisediminis]
MLDRIGHGLAQRWHVLIVTQGHAHHVRAVVDGPADALGKNLGVRTEALLDGPVIRRAEDAHREQVGLGSEAHDPGPLDVSPSDEARDGCAVPLGVGLPVGAVAYEVDPADHRIRQVRIAGVDAGIHHRDHGALPRRLLPCSVALQHRQRRWRLRGVLHVAALARASCRIDRE